MTMTMTDAVVVDIGGDTGALVVYAPEDLIGHEIEIARDDDDVDMSHPVHNVVRRRQIGTRSVCAAVFPDLAGGMYAPYGDPQLPADAFRVRGGSVTEIEWRPAYWTTESRMHVHH